MTGAQILALLPYRKPFLFVDEITQVDENQIEGHYSFSKEEFFYIGHFPGFPLTPGVILIECMAQIGLVALGIYLLDQQGIHISFSAEKLPLFTSSNIQFYKKVLPGEKVVIKGEKVVFRHHKLRSNVKMTNEMGETVCDGLISGMFV